VSRGGGYDDSLGLVTWENVIGPLDTAATGGV